MSDPTGGYGGVAHALPMDSSTQDAEDRIPLSAEDEDLRRKMMNVPHSYPPGVTKEMVDKWETRVADVTEAVHEIMNADIGEFDRRREKREAERRERIDEMRRSFVKERHKRRYNLDYSRFNDDRLIDRVEQQLDREAKQFVTTDPSTFTKTEKILMEEAERMKKEGNEAYNKNDAMTAFARYDSGVQLCPPDHLLLLALRNNRAMAALKCEKYDQCVEDATWVLTYEPKNLKALQRRAAASIELHRVEDALTDLHVARQLSQESYNVTIETMLTKATEEHAENMKELRMSESIRDEVDRAAVELQKGFEGWAKVSIVVEKPEGGRIEATDEDVEKASVSLARALTAITKLMYTTEVDSIEVRLRKKGVVQKVFDCLVGFFTIDVEKKKHLSHSKGVVTMCALMFLASTLRSRYTLALLRGRVEEVLPHVVALIGTASPPEVSAIRFISAVTNDVAITNKLEGLLSVKKVESASKDMTARCVTILLDALLYTRKATWDTPSLHAVAIRACCTELNSKDQTAVRDALSCLLRVSLSADLSDGLIQSVARAHTQYPADGYITEAVFSIAYNTIIRRGDREGLLSVLSAEGLHVTATQCIRAPENDRVLCDRALTLLGKMIALPAVRRAVFPTPRAGAELFLPFLDGTKVFSDVAMEQSTTIIARALLSKDDGFIIPTESDVFTGPYLTALLRSPNARTSGNAALLAGHLATVDVTRFAKSVPGVVEALLDAIKNARNISFEGSASKVSAARDDILSASEVEKQVHHFTEQELLTAQKNAAIALSRLAVVPGCRATLEALKGFEILQTVVRSTGMQ